jgi:MoxR-like ATPase
MSLNMGYPPPEDERQLLMSGGVDDLLESIEPALGREELVGLQGLARRVRVAEKLVDYILAFAAATRGRGEFAMPVSTRGVQNLYWATQALALCEGRDYAVPDDVQRLAVPVLGHRVMLKRGSGGLEESRAAIRHVVEATPVPL